MGNRSIQVLVKKAQQSICKYKVAAMGFNHRGNCLGSMSNAPRFSREGGSLHAELRLMRRYRSQLKTILIVRTNNKGELKPIEPCRVCAAVAEILGIKIRSIQ